MRKFVINKKFNIYCRFQIWSIFFPSFSLFRFCIYVTSHEGFIWNYSCIERINSSNLKILSYIQQNNRTIPNLPKDFPKSKSSDLPIRLTNDMEQYFVIPVWLKSSENCFVQRLQFMSLIGGLLHCAHLSLSRFLCPDVNWLRQSKKSRASSFKICKIFQPSPENLNGHASFTDHHNFCSWRPRYTSVLVSFFFFFFFEIIMGGLLWPTALQH